MRSIPEKESLTVEFKSDRKRYPDRELVEEIVGMANTKGGELYLGVEDDGAVTGVHDAHRDEIGVVALIANSTVPSLSVRAKLIRDAEKDILRIDVPMSRAIISTSSGKMLRRRLKLDGTPENVPLFPYEITTRLSELSLLDFSAQAVSGADYSDLNPVERERLRNIIQNQQGDHALRDLPDEELDRALRLVVMRDGRLVPTVTGMLLIGKTEKIRELIPTAGASFQVLTGTQIKINEVTQEPLLAVFEQFETYIKAWNPEKEVEYGLFRIPVPEFSPAAFREGLVNAFCHRDYSMLGNVRVMIDDEGMTISSPGGFIDGVNLENLLTVEPHGRNPALADALKRIGLAERTGRGIDRIYEGSVMYGRPWPDYSESTERNVRLFIQRAKPDAAFIKLVADEQNRQGNALSVNTLLILSLLKYERKMTVSAISDRIHLPDARIMSVLENMVESGLAEASGRGRNRTYMLSAQIYRMNDETKQYVRQRGIDKIRYPEMIMKLAQEQQGIITRDDVQQLLHTDAPGAYKYIRQLVDEGKLEKVYGGRYAKYALINRK